jgi:hypothetical protein
MLFNYGTFNYIWLINGVLVLLGSAVGMYFYNKNESYFSDYV